MPIYEYKCEHCDDTFEILQKINEKPLTECIMCHEGPVKKLISVSSFVLKGSGFYVNDYPSASRKTAKGEEKEKGSKSSESKSTDSTKSSAKKETTKAA